jgi:ABC-type polysaccharide/polyol phosphate transport system ATPase subunit/ABC-type polysaccharide/polyol phosphate export permease
MRPAVLAILTRAAFAREFRRGASRVVLSQALLPIGIVWFFDFIEVDVARAPDGWAMLGVAVVIWWLFANASRAGMVLWDERHLVDGTRIPVWMVVAPAALVPVGVFVAHLAILEVAMSVGSAGSAVSAEVVVAGGIALAAGLAAGLLAARALRLRRARASLPAVLLAATFIATPVLYPVSALEGAADAWCSVNSVCAAVELGRAGVADVPTSLPGAAVPIAAVLAGLLLGAALVLNRRPSLLSTARSGSPVLVVSGIGSTAAERGVTGRLALEEGEIVVAVGDHSDRTRFLAIAAGLHASAGSRVEVRGGVSSLLDPRLGFHSSLSGRDNVRLRAHLQGVAAPEVAERLRAVLRFAEVESRAHVPAGRLSAAERTRLGFATMVFLPGGLLVWDDDVLARVPDFRTKCLALVAALLRDGRSILIGTSDVGKVDELSPRAVWIDEEGVRADGPSRLVVAELLAPRVVSGPVDDTTTTSPCRVVGIHQLDEHGEPAQRYLPGDPIVVALDLQLRQPVERPYLVLGIAGRSGPITAAATFLDGHRPASLDGNTRVECHFEGLVLAPGHTFTVRFAIYADDGWSIVYPKREVAHFVMGGSAADCGFAGAKAENRILSTAPVVSRYSWKFQGAAEEWFGGAQGRRSPQLP